MVLTWAATSSSPACALISAVVETLRLSQDKVAVLAGDACKQGMNEAQAVAHGRQGAHSPHKWARDVTLEVPCHKPMCRRARRAHLHCLHAPSRVDPLDSTAGRPTASMPSRACAPLNLHAKAANCCFTAMKRPNLQVASVWGRVISRSIAESHFSVPSADWEVSPMCDKNVESRSQSDWSRIWVDESHSPLEAR